MSTLEQAQTAEVSLRILLRKQPWVFSTGVMWSTKNRNYAAITVDVTDPGAASKVLPKEWSGVPVSVGEVLKGRGPEIPWAPGYPKPRP